MSENDGGSAFPRGGGNSSNGMSLRDFFAAVEQLGQAIRGACGSREDKAEDCYKRADAMLKAQEK